METGTTLTEKQKMLREALLEMILKTCQVYRTIKDPMKKRLLKSKLHNYGFLIAQLFFDPLIDFEVE